MKPQMTGLKLPKVLKKNTHQAFQIVAIGASVGGLKAVTNLLKNLPVDTGMAYIYVQHLNPDHKSMLPEILSKITRMRVQEIEQMELMKPNNVYVMPNDKIIQVTDGHIELLPRPKKGSSISIDVLFDSLARVHHENVIGIVLTGNGTDGTKGLTSIKANGGITIAQDSSAEAGSMPQSAIAAGVVDFVLSPKEIARKLARFHINGLPVRSTKEKRAATLAAERDPNLKAILQLLYEKKSVDFSHYKMATIKRRLNHKMVQHGSKSVKDYLALLQKDATELDQLYASLLINVTSFMRDHEAFDYLKKNLLPKLLHEKEQGGTIRIWVPACSTGQEAYSLAIIIAGLQTKRAKKIPVQIFATDLSDDAIKEARAGQYKAELLEPLSKKQIDCFFIKDGINYRVNKEIREMCVFAPHNILRDPPFARMDFISCCNLLIYFDASAQKNFFHCSTLHSMSMDILCLERLKR